MTYESDKLYYLMKFYTEAQIDLHCAGDNQRLTNLWNLCQPQDLPIKQIVDSFDNSELVLVGSPDGWVPVVDTLTKFKIKMYDIVTSQGHQLSCSYDHFVQMHDLDWKYAQNLKIGDQIITNSGVDQVIEVKERPGAPTYDLEIGHENHRYYTNGISSHNSGKSLFLQNLAVNFIMQGLNVIYISLELSEELCAMRIDSMISNVSTKEIFKRLDDVEIKVSQTGKKSGSLHIKQLPQGTTTNDLRAYLKNYEIETSHPCDVLIVDYLDLLFPNNRKLDLSNLNIVGKFITEELRGLGVEKNINIQTASQLNRSAVNELEHDHSHIAGGISKIQTADNVMSIYSTPAMKERGQYQVQFLKTRSSSGVGSRITLGFNTETLRIYDIEEGDEVAAPKSATSMMADLRRRNHASDGDNNTAAAVTDQSSTAKNISTLKELTSLIRR
jgi:archaellum biogenesis ATPase FlaH